MNLLTVENWGDYQFLDSGDELKLERFGAVYVQRPAAGAIWRREKPELWRRANAIFQRTSATGGKWVLQQTPAEWSISWNDVQFWLRPTPMGHLGIFPEQSVNWRWLESTLKGVRDARVLNLFAYTGAASLVVARAGASVTHVDSAKAAIHWAQRNAQENGIEAGQIRWVVEDAATFVRREKKRGSRYDVLIIDPPSFGRSERNRVWKIERDLGPLVDDLLSLLRDSACCLVLTAHSAFITASVLANFLSPLEGRQSGSVTSGEIVHQADSSGKRFPGCAFARWNRGG